MNYRVLLENTIQALSNKDYNDLHHLVKVAVENHFIDTNVDISQLGIETENDIITLTELGDEFVNAKLITRKKLCIRGWTNGIMQQFGLVPHLVCKNPYNKGMGETVDYYNLCYIEHLQQTKEFKDFLIQLVALKEGQNKSGNRYTIKRQQIITMARNVQIEISQHRGNRDLQSLIASAVNSYNELHPESKQASVDDDPEFLARICTNYLRHRCSPYEDLLISFREKPGWEEAYIIIKNRVNGAIQNIFGDLEYEIGEWQLERCLPFAA